MDRISIRGAKTHNLKNIDVDIPKNQLVVITGLSGSGKSSLAFDTIYAEGQRRYVESLSTYARQFLSVMEKPDVAHISGLSPAISIEQKSALHNPRSTVGTITEIHDYLRLLFARVGTPKCPHHDIVLSMQTISQMVDATLALPENEKIMLLAPIIKNRKGEHKKLLMELQKQGYLRARINGVVTEIENMPPLDLYKKHNIEIVVDRLKVRADLTQRLSESFETALNLSGGIAKLAAIDKKSSWQEMTFSAHFSCPECGYNLEELEPRLFSFNSPVGACSVCDGIGFQDVFDPAKIVEHPRLSLADGAIYGWGRANAFYYQILCCVAQHYQFDINTPFKQLDDKIQDIILHGSNQESINFTNIPAARFPRKKKHGPFAGIIPYMARRYQDSTSNLAKERLARYITTMPCQECGGGRLNERARHVFINNENLPQLGEKSIAELLRFFTELHLIGQKNEIAQKILQEITQRLSFLNNVGLEYLSLNRRAGTLSGGEAQRIRLASQIGSGLMGVLYVLDEPSIGLHQRDNQKLLSTLTYLRDLGNTVIVVEHDQEAIESADHIVDIGPGAGQYGGEIIATGNLDDIKINQNSLTGKYLTGERTIEVPVKRKKSKQFFKIYGASGNNLKNIDFALPVGVTTCITGVSGSGKSTLINDTLYPLVANHLHRTSVTGAPHQKFSGIKAFDKVVNIDQSPIGRTPRSNPATYTGVFTLIRALFAQTLESRSRGYQAGRFSFNVRGGRCEACQGDGLIKVEMHFLSDIYVKCDVCQGARYNRETLEVQYKQKNIADVLNMTVVQAADFFQALPPIYKKLQTLNDVGLSYLTLGQNAVTLSGGEAQRIKLAKELSKNDTGHTLYILDEPTTGLHFQDVKQLLSVIRTLRDRGNTIVIIEHNLDVIKTADWIVDLGPEGGDKGGEIIATGTPEQLAAMSHSYTGHYLAKYLETNDKVQIKEA